MSSKTKIEWTECNWNPVTGCTKVSPGCANCYAEPMALRLRGMGKRGYENGFGLTLMPDRLEQPLSRKNPTMYFVNSMSDLFHEEVPFEYVDRVFDVINRAPQHTFQILTKRAARMAEYGRNRQLPANAWMGVTVEDKRFGLPRLDHLRQVPASIRFVSIEPLLENLGEVNLTGIHWVIVGGESGPKARPMRPEWVEHIKRQCDQQQTPFFFKQWGTWGADGVKRDKKKNGRTLEGRIWDGMPMSTTL